MTIDKKLLDQSTNGHGNNHHGHTVSQGSAGTFPVPISGSVSSLDGGFSLAPDKLEQLTERLDQMYKDVKHLKKDVFEVKSSYKTDIEGMRIEISNKAEKEMLLENQKQFFI